MTSFVGIVMSTPVGKRRPPEFMPEISPIEEQSVSQYVNYSKIIYTNSLREKVQIIIICNVICFIIGI